MTVLAFPEKQKEQTEKTLAGSARCLVYHHEWVAVAPVGTLWLDCPACGSGKGFMKYPCGPSAEKDIWHCGCGSDTFYITREEISCCVCGSAQLFPPPAPIR